MTDIEYDEAGNRKDYTVTGSDGSGSDGGVTGVDGGGNSGGGNDGGSSPETPPRFIISDATAVEGRGLRFTITKQGSVSSNYSVNYATANGSARLSSDYGARSGTLSFTGSQTSKTITIPTVDDSVFEQTEVLYLNLSSPTGGATISDDQGAGTISDNDTANSPPIAVADFVFGSCFSQRVFDVKANDSDPDNGDSITVISTNVPRGAITDGSAITFQSNVNAGVYTYVLRDSQGATANGSITYIRNCDGGFVQF